MHRHCPVPGRINDFTWQQELSTGGRYNIVWQNLRSTTNSAFSGFNPLYAAALSGEISQPLLQNFRYDPNKQRLIAAQNGERISRSQFEFQVMDAVRDVEFAYWDLVFAIRDLEVAQESVELARDLLRNNRIQVEVGTMAPIGVLEAEAEVAVREEAVILAEEAIYLNEDSLKRFINDPESGDFWGSDYVPQDEPTVEPYEIDLEDAVRVALERRPVLEQLRVELETRDYDVRFTKNQMQPQVDVVGSVALNGIGGRQLVREDFAGQPSVIIPGGYGDAMDQLFGGDFRDWSLGLEVSYPLGNSQAAASHAQAQVAERQQQARNRLRGARRCSGGSPDCPLRAKRIASASMRPASRAELADRRLDAEQKKFEVGMSTSFFIVQAQRDLAQARANELRARIDYIKAIAAFERARGTTLDRANVGVR